MGLGVAKYIPFILKTGMYNKCSIERIKDGNHGRL